MRITKSPGDLERFELPTSGFDSRALSANPPAPAKGSRGGSKGREQGSLWATGRPASTSMSCGEPPSTGLLWVPVHRCGKRWV